MAREFSADILICGAGASGLTLALELARRGISFQLIEKLPEPFAGSRGKGIQPRTQEIFEDLGILDRLFAVGGLYPPQRDHQAEGSFTDKPMYEHADPTPAEPYQMPLMVPQFLTERVLRERLLEFGHAPRFGAELVGFVQDDEGVTATVKGKGADETIRARSLVGADGGRSFVRRELAIEFPGKTLGMRAVVADLHVQGLSRDAWHRFNEGNLMGQISLCPLMGTDLFQLQAPIPLEGDFDLSSPALARFFVERSGRPDIVIKDVSWASAYQMNARLADRYRVDRVLLIGDAAHIHPPTGGQGLNTSVQDSYNLGWKFAAALAGAPDALLDTYEEERRAVAAGVLGLSTKLLDASKQGDMRRGREVRQLDLSYAGSSLAPETAARAKLRAGDRAPDAPIHGAAGEPKRLFDIFQGPHWTLLTHGEPSIPPRAGLYIRHIGPHADLRDTDRHFHDAYGLEPSDVILIRPDGYVGLIAAASDTATLETYLARVGLPPS